MIFAILLNVLLLNFLSLVLHLFRPYICAVPGYRLWYIGILWWRVGISVGVEFGLNKLCKIVFASML